MFCKNGWVMDESEARALLCQLLPGLRARAETGRWTGRLDTVLAPVRDGGSAAEALTRLGLEPSAGEAPGGDRGGPGPHALWGGSRTEVTGAYVCPGTPPCPRRSGRDADGRPPVCSLRDVLMTFRQS